MKKKGFDSHLNFLLGKIKNIKQLESIKFRNFCITFGDLEMTQEDIGKAGIELIVRR